jgi:hypothetical protein
MSAEAKQSSATMPNQAGRDKFRAMLAELSKPENKKFGLIESRYFRWNAGELPELLHFLVEHKPLVAKLLEDAVRYEIEHPTPDEPTPEEK